MLYPKGWGLYGTRRSYTRPLGSVAASAIKAREARIRNVCLLVEGEDGYCVPLKKLKDVVETYRELSSATIHLYSLPGDPDKAADSGRLLAAMAEAVKADGVQGDIERAFKGRPDAVDEFLRPLKCLDPRQYALGVSSYPIMVIHKTMPWKQMRWGYGSPQIYKTAINGAQAQRAISVWGEAHGGVVVPALACFETPSPGEGAAQLRGDAERVLLRDGKPIVEGCFLWAEPALDAQERAFLREWAEKYNW
jgi:hypothetical protein